MQFAGFRPKRMTNGSMNLPGVEAAVIVGNATLIVKEGSSLKIGTGGVLATATDSDPIVGYCVGFTVKYGDLNLPLRTVADNSNYVDGTYTFATAGSQYVAATDNITDKQISALYIPAEDVICSAKLDADVATTTGSGLVGYYQDIEETAGNAGTLLDESDSSTTDAQWINVAGRSGTSSIDPAAPETADRRIMVRANELEIA